MKKSVLAGLLLAACLGLAGCGKDGGKSAVTDKGVPNPLRVATEGAYPPFNLTDTSGKLVGFEIDMMNEACKRLNTTCQFIPQVFDSSIAGLQAGRYDVIASGMSVTPERRQAVAFTRGYVSNLAYLVAAKTDPLAGVDFGVTRIDLNNLDEAAKAAIDKLRGLLKDKVIGVQSGTIHANFADQYLQGLNVRRYESMENLALDVGNARVDVALGDLVTWDPFLKSDRGQNYALVGPSFDGGLFGEGIGLALRKSDAKLLDALNGTLDSIKQDGLMKQWAVQWFGFDNVMP